MRNLVNQPIVKSLLVLAVPTIIANVLQSAYQITDLFWIGKLGAEGVAAVSVCFPIIFFFISLAMGLSIGGSILVSQFKGKGTYNGINDSAGQSVMLAFFVSIFLGLIGFLFSDTIIGFMSLEADVALSAISYLRISFIGIIFVFGYMTFQGLLRGVGEVKLPAMIVFFTVLLNLVVDPIFILGWGIIPAFGVAGAAIATIITQGIAYFFALFVLFRGSRGISLSFINFKPKKRLIKKIFNLGLPTSLSMSTRSLGMVIMTYIITGFGTVVIASYGIGHQLFVLVFFPVLGLSMASSILVGQNIGADKKQSACEVGIKAMFLAFIFLLLLSFICYIFAPDFVRIFNTDPAVVAEASKFIRVMCYAFVFLGIAQVLNGVFQGAGDTKTAMKISLFTMWIIQLPFAYFVSNKIGSIGIWMSIPIANTVFALIALFWFFKGRWMHKSAVKDMEYYT